MKRTYDELMADRIRELLVDQKNRGARFQLP